MQDVGPGPVRVHRWPTLFDPWSGSVKTAALVPGPNAPALDSTDALARPLEEASRRLRRPPGRPRASDTNGDTAPRRAAHVPAVKVRADVSTVVPVAPRPSQRLLDRATAARYLGVSTDMLDRLVHRYALPRLVLGTRCVRFDIHDLDRFVEHSRAS